MQNPKLILEISIKVGNKNYLENTNLNIGKSYLKYSLNKMCWIYQCVRKNNWRSIQKDGETSQEGYINHSLG